jgi:2-dehydro-3-deoxy-D-arabinonate dehydratase
LKICTFEASGVTRLGVLDGEEFIEVRAHRESFLDQVLKENPETVKKSLKGAPRFPYAYECLRLPIRPAEIWGAGVTYLRSREARETETQTKGVYDFLYSAVRPEVFLKGSGQRANGPGEYISVRNDSDWTVPEPELAIVLNKDVFSQKNFVVEVFDEEIFRRP